MAVVLIVEPGKVVSWEEFREDYPYRSIAIDGFCRGIPRFDENKMILNINHHEGVDSMATRSSCYQAVVHVKMGLYEGFCSLDGTPDAQLFVNDCDQDVALATFVLMYPQYIGRPILQRLIRLEDLMDMSAGSYPPPRNKTVLRQLAWITLPYTEARISGKLKEMDAAQMEAVIKLMHRRIRAAMFGRVREIPLDTQFEVIEEHDGWHLVREIGRDAKLGIAEQGIKAYVSLISEKDGRYHYSICRRSRFISFPLPLLFRHLNDFEGVTKDDTDRWGGGDTHGGSPREKGSSLKPQEVAMIVKAALEEYRERKARLAARRKNGT